MTPSSCTPISERAPSVACSRPDARRPGRHRGGEPGRLAEAPRSNPGGRRVPSPFRRRCDRRPRDPCAARGRRRRGVDRRRRLPQPPAGSPASRGPARGRLRRRRGQLADGRRGDGRPGVRDPGRRAHVQRRPGRRPPVRSGRPRSLDARGALGRARPRATHEPVLQGRRRLVVDRRHPGLRRDGDRGRQAGLGRVRGRAVGEDATRVGVRGRHQRRGQRAPRDPSPSTWATSGSPSSPRTTSPSRSAAASRSGSSPTTRATRPGRAGRCTARASSRCRRSRPSCGCWRWATSCRGAGST